MFGFSDFTSSGRVSHICTIRTRHTSSSNDLKASSASITISKHIKPINLFSTLPILPQKTKKVCYSIKRAWKTSTRLTKSSNVSSPSGQEPTGLNISANGQVWITNIVHGRARRRSSRWRKSRLTHIGLGRARPSSLIKVCSTHGVKDLRSPRSQRIRSIFRLLVGNSKIFSWRGWIGWHMSGVRERMVFWQMRWVLERFVLWCVVL